MMVTAAELAEAASDLEARAAAFERSGDRHRVAADDLQSAVDTLERSWTSPVADRFRADGAWLVERHRPLGPALEAAAAEVRGLASTASELADRLRTLERDRDNTASELRSANASVMMTLDPLARQAAVTRSNDLNTKLQGTERGITSLVADWDRACTSTGSALAPAIDALKPSDRARSAAISFALMQLGVPPGSWSRVPEGDPWFDLLVATQLANPDLGEEELLRLAAEEWLGSFADDLGERLERGHVPADMVEELESVVAGHRILSVVLLEQLGPERLVGFAPTLSQVVAPLGLGHPVNEPDMPNPERELGGRTLDALAIALTRASKDPTFDPTYASQLVDLADRQHGAAFGLSELLHRGGAMEPGFALTIAEGAYAIERAAGGDPVWLPRAEYEGLGVPQGLSGPGSWDLMTGVSAMLSRDALTAQEFLLAGDEGDPDRNRLSYLTSSRRWRTDEGVAFGAMIEAAATSFREDLEEGSPTHRSAMIAAQYLEELPYDGTRFHIYDGMLAPTGTILAVYIEDVQQTLIRTNDDRAGQPSGTAAALTPEQHHIWGIEFSRPDELLRAVTTDDEAYLRLVAAQQDLQYRNLDVAASGWQPDSEDAQAAAAEAMEFAVEVNARTASSILLARNENLVEDAVRSDAERQALLGLVETGIGAAPVPGGPLARPAVRALTTQFTGMAATDHTSAAIREVRSAEDALIYNQTDALHAAQVRHGWHGPAIEAASFVSDGEIIPVDEMSEEQRSDYIDWYRNSPAGTGMNNHIETFTQRSLGASR